MSYRIRPLASGKSSKRTRLPGTDHVGKSLLAPPTEIYVEYMFDLCGSQGTTFFLGSCHGALLVMVSFGLLLFPSGKVSVWF
ncbi:MAG: hypothetical protein V3R29_02395, partial [Candidatus Acidoferrales bacterium]